MSLILYQLEKVKHLRHKGFSYSVRATTPQEYRTAKKIDKVELKGCLKSLNYYSPWRLEIARQLLQLFCSPTRVVHGGNPQDHTRSAKHWLGYTRLYLPTQS